MYSPWQDFGNSFSNAGNSIARTALAVRALQQRRQQQQQNYAMLAPLREAQTQHYGEENARLQQQIDQSGEQSSIADTIGRAREYSGELENPELSNNQELIGQVVQFLRSRGSLPTSQASLEPDNANMLLKSLAAALAGRQAAMSPSSAASLLDPHNIGQRDIAVDRFGNEVGRGALADEEPYHKESDDFQYITGTPGGAEGVFNRKTGAFNKTGTRERVVQDRISPDAALHALTGSYAPPDDLTNVLHSIVQQGAAKSLQQHTNDALDAVQKGADINDVRALFIKVTGKVPNF